ncbi:MAG: L-seryl-tRNA(Sec) selenium transferase [Deltaproteobacteria bacterium]|nr:L-seryl-tRNA(Sec) selenium transferase [Deltaproteobacteria bacterium]
MVKTENKQHLLRMLPGVDHILEIMQTHHDCSNIPKSVLVNSIRSAIEGLRTDILKSGQDAEEKKLSEGVMTEQVVKKVQKNIAEAMTPNLRRTVNGTGVVVHTNLGRSILPKEAIEHMADIASSYSNLEFDIQKGTRGIRYSCVDDILCEISGAESSLVVNNNAGAVLLCLEAVSRGRSVIVSRGELVEIGGSFRIPDVMAKSGGILKEIGTTNRTHLKDYEDAIDDETGLLLKVHTSNYNIVGFTSDVALTELVELGSKYSVPVMEDLGSGTFIDFSRYGMKKEPTVQDSVKTGADIVTFSGDKLLGGPQAGIIVGKMKIIEKIKKSPLTRALRIDKLTLAALEATLRFYRDPERALKTIPTLKMLTEPLSAIDARAKRLSVMLNGLNNSNLKISIGNITSRAGGGAFPMMDLPSMCVGVEIGGMSANDIEMRMRGSNWPVIGRIEDDIFVMDLRTVAEDELNIIYDAVEKILQEPQSGLQGQD